jgi:hypothetical protein
VDILIVDHQVDVDCSSCSFVGGGGGCFPKGQASVTLALFNSSFFFSWCFYGVYMLNTDD